MKRDLAAMAQKRYDLLVVGGGITGACIARDAAMRGLAVALVEKNDFASATTAGSSKLIHGGLRYLQNFEFGLVRESLRERRIWSSIAPHMVHPLSFLIPSRGAGLKSRFMMSAGLTLYDWLAFDRNRLDDPEKHIPAHERLTRERAIEIEPALAEMPMTGAMVYHDCQMVFPERLALECIAQAAEHGADAANYAAAESLERNGGAVAGARVRDLISGETHRLRARLVVNAAGPWADLLLASMGGEPSVRLVRSKGIHLITRPLTRRYAIAVPSRGSHFFILPWRGYSLIGTTDTAFNASPDELCVTEQDIAQFLAIVNDGFPAAKLTRDDILSSYAGLRPLVLKTNAANGETYLASRESEIVVHEQHGGPRGLVSAIGGKWTTSRSLAEQVADLAVKHLGFAARACATHNTPTPGGTTGRFSEFVAEAKRKHPAFSGATVELLASTYGSRMSDVITLAEREPELAAPIAPGRSEIGAQIAYAARVEMAFSLGDALFRRTSLGMAEHPGDAAMERASLILARELGWSEEERARQLARAESKWEKVSA